MRTISILIAAIFISSAASAQQWSDVNVDNPHGYFPASFVGQPASSLNPADVLLSACASPTNCAYVGLNIQNFAETNYVNSQFSGLNNQISSMQANFSALSSEVGALDSKLSLGVARADQIAVISAAMKDAVPNDGDRFALRMNMATWNGQAAGSMSFSANITDKVRFSVDYGRGQNQNMFSGGVNFSFN
jgi:hypothetical protein